jgi:hypothetical protein
MSFNFSETDPGSLIYVPDTIVPMSERKNFTADIFVANLGFVSTIWLLLFYIEPILGFEIGPGIEFRGIGERFIVVDPPGKWR